MTASTTSYTDLAAQFFDVQAWSHRAHQLSALGSLPRLQILLAFAENPAFPITDLAHRMGVSQSVVSRHIYHLVRAGILTKDGHSHRVHKEVIANLFADMLGRFALAGV